MIELLLNQIRAEKIMEGYNLVALIASSPVNVFYLSDTSPYGDNYVILPYEQNADPALISPLIGSPPVVLSSPPWIRDVRYYGTFYIESIDYEDSFTEPETKYINARRSWEKNRENDPISIMIDVLKERGITKGRIGIDESNLPVNDSFWQRIKKKLPNIRLIPAKNIFKKIRMIKTQEEIRRIDEALKITLKAWETSLESTREGMTEKEFAEIFDHTIISEGGRVLSKNGFYGPPIGFGKRTAFVDIADPSDYKIKKGDIIRFDGGAGYLGYPSDFARCAVLSQPSTKLTKYYNAITEGEQLALDMAKPGVKVSDIYNAVIEKVRESGIPHFKRHHVGHGWGIEGYDPPLVTPKNHTLLEEGMLLDFETPYYEVGWGGLLNEDVLVITKTGSRLLTKPRRELYII